MFRLPVSHVRWLAPDIFELALERADVVFEPGESVVLFGPSEISRPYSIASGGADPLLRFVIRRMSGGALSPWLAERRAGDVLEVSHPFGEFRPGVGDRAGGGAVFVATGVGIAPFLSYLSGPVAPARKPICLYGVRQFRDAVGIAILRERSDLTLAVSREDLPPAHGIFQGRVTGVLDRLPLAGDRHYCLCGSDAMVDTVTYWLRNHGVPPERLHGEVFFP